jgi:hypothetical protein
MLNFRRRDVLSGFIHEYHAADRMMETEYPTPHAIRR